MGFPVAIWRLPESQELKLLVSDNGTPQSVLPDFDKLGQGFLMARFDADSEALFLEGNLVLSFPAANAALDPASIGLLSDSDFGARLLDRAYQAQLRTAPAADNSLVPIDTEVTSERFRRIVELGAEAVKAGQLFKVVLSRTKSFGIGRDFSLIKAFFQLESAYPAAFVSMVFLPAQQEVWLGASPEVLVSVRQRRFFRTVALAGTQTAHQASGALKPKFSVLWSEKEIEEQAIVSRYIIECFKRIRLREYIETGPKSSRAGNLYHLKSDFEVDLQAVNFPELGSVMLRLLHPTSAVCGMPKEEALALIRTLEGYDRSFYSGYWGPVNVENDTNLYVNLRTLRVRNSTMTLFAGAGITADSDPEAEWNETEIKCDTLLGVIDPSACSGNHAG